MSGAGEGGEGLGCVSGRRGRGRELWSGEEARRFGDVNGGRGRKETKIY